MRRALALTIFVVYLPQIGFAKAPLGVTVCEIAAHPSKFHNKTVRIRAAAISGMEAAFLTNYREGKDHCGMVNLDFEAVEHDKATDEFLQLFGAQITFPQCDREKELNAGIAYILDPKAPAPKPCLDSFCWHCPRYNIVATFTGKLRYSGREAGHARFGHLGMFMLQLDVRSVSNLEVADTQPAEKP